MKKGSKQGFISWIILALIALATLKYVYDWSLFDALASEEGKGTVEYIRDLLDAIWFYIGAPVTFAWNNVVWPVLEFAWDSFQLLLEAGREALN